MTAQTVPAGEPVNYALLADNPVRWLLDREGDVRRAVVEFLRRGDGRTVIAVAGPPTAQQMLRYRDDPTHLDLPTVNLVVERTVAGIDKVPAVKVSVSESGRSEIIRWHNEARLRAVMASGRA